MSYKVAIVGATGAVGLKFIECLERRNFPVSDLQLFASDRSEGKVLHFRGTPIRVQALKESLLKGFDFALYSAGSDVSKRTAPVAAGNGAVVIDNSSAWRMDPAVPLVVPEVNPHDLAKHKGIIANPNCSTIQMVVALKPIYDAYGIRRVVVATYQAVSGAGGRALSEFENETRAQIFDDPKFKRAIFPRQIAFNAIPQIPQKDAFQEEGYTTEEWKMIRETRKIMGDDSIRVCPTTVRVPVKNAHSEVVNVETVRPFEMKDLIEKMKAARGLVLKDKQEDFPTPAEVSGREEVFVGRLRRDLSVEHGVVFWCVADNLLKGAALNAVQIAEYIIRK